MCVPVSPGPLSENQSNARVTSPSSISQGAADIERGGSSERRSRLGRGRLGRIGVRLIHRFRRVHARF